MRTKTKINLIMLKYLLSIFLCLLQEPILSADFSVYPKNIERNSNNRGEFQVYVSGMDEITQMTLQSGNEIISVNFEKITISNCQIFEYEKECIESLIGCQWSDNKCLSATECSQLSQNTCEKTTNALKERCEWDTTNNICKVKSSEIKSCDEFTLESDCKSSLFGCQWSDNECSSATECLQLSQTTCEKTTNALKDKCEWDTTNNICKVKTSEIKSCDEFKLESDCKSSLYGCQWSDNKCSSATECAQLSQNTCEKTTNALKERCEWDTTNNICKVKSSEIKSCDEFTLESDCKSSLFGCQWSNNKCSSATECLQLSQTTCEKTTNALKDKCEWDTKNKKCIIKVIEINSCNEFNSETNCKTSLLGCQWSDNKCLSATECPQLSESICEKSTYALKDKCEWDIKNNICKVKTSEIKSCDEFTLESDCKSSLFGCRWSDNKCLSATECAQLTESICEKSINSLRDKCDWNTKNNTCVNKKLCEYFKDSTNCTKSVLGCQWYYEKCIDYFSCNQFGFPLCENTPGKFKDKCEWYIAFYRSTSHCLSKQTSALNCNENVNEEDCKRSILGCYWYKEECIAAEQCQDFSDFSVCLNNTGALKDKCEWYTGSYDRYCRGKRNSAEKCSDNINKDDCVRCNLGCRWYKDECIEAEQCNDLSDFTNCLNNTSVFKDKCEWYTGSYDRYCLSKQTLDQNCNENMNELDCTRSFSGCRWYKNACIKAEHCNQLTYFSVCLNNTHESLKNKCDWYTGSSKRYCQDKSETNYIDKCKNVTYEDCQRGLNGCYWISEKCILPTKCSDFNQTICQNIKSYSSFSGVCEWNESTTKCQRKAKVYGLCSDNKDENDCSRSLLGCAWVNNKCVNAHQCSLLSSSACENLVGNAILYGDCEWNEITTKCQRKAKVYGLCSDNKDENDCSRSSLGCAWVNNKCVNAHQCSLLSSSACENLVGNAILYNVCEWNKSTKKCQRKAKVYGLCSDYKDENDCSRSLLGCAWINNKCVTSHQCSSLSSSVCENLDGSSFLSGECKWNDNDKICLKKKSIRLIRNLVDDEVTTKYKCSFNFPDIDENKNFNLALVDKSNNKASISLSLIPPDSDNEETSDNNEFVIYRSRGSFLKLDLYISLILILLLFMIKN